MIKRKGKHKEQTFLRTPKHMPLPIGEFVTVAIKWWSYGVPLSLWPFTVVRQEGRQPDQIRFYVFMHL